MQIIAKNCGKIAENCGKIAKICEKLRNNCENMQKYESITKMNECSAFMGILIAKIYEKSEKMRK